MIDIICLCNRYHKLLPYTSTSESDNLGEQFAEYQLLDKEDIPKHVLDDASMRHTVWMSFGAICPI